MIKRILNRILNWIVPDDEVKHYERMRGPVTGSMQDDYERSESDPDKRSA